MSTLIYTSFSVPASGSALRTASEALRASPSATSRVSARAAAASRISGPTGDPLPARRGAAPPATDGRLRLRAGLASSTASSRHAALIRFGAPAPRLPRQRVPPPHHQRHPPRVACSSHRDRVWQLSKRPVHQESRQRLPGSPCVSRGDLPRWEIARPTPDATRVSPLGDGTAQLAPRDRPGRPMSGVQRCTDRTMARLNYPASRALRGSLPCRKVRASAQPLESRRRWAEASRR
jgi:hypothetical protein